LQAGDCIRDSKGHHSAGIIIGVNHLDKFYSGDPHYSFYDINDCTNSYSGHLDYDEEFTVINSRREILRYYNVIELELLRESADCLDRRRELIGIRRTAIDRMNDKLDKLKGK
jgi:hypothetical protein